jgi:pimeloyl-ACP methyl ester carboxylesterase
LILIAASGIRRQNLKKNVLSGLSSIVGPITPTKIKDKVYAYLGSDYSSALTPTLKQVIKYALSTDVSKFAKSINIPTLLLYGDADSSTPLWMGQELKELIPDARIQVIPGGDHWIHEKHPDEIANLIVGSTNG